MALIDFRFFRYLFVMRLNILTPEIGVGKYSVLGKLGSENIGIAEKIYTGEDWDLVRLGFQKIGI